MNCKKCNTKIPNARYQMGYDICVSCSTEEKVSCHTIYPHKTGGYIQVVSKEQSENLNRLDRRGTGTTKAAKHYKPFVVKKKEEPKKIRVSRCNKVYTPYNKSLKQVLDYYDEWGYQPTIKYLRQLSSTGEIPLNQRVQLQDMVTEIEMTPSPRALTRKFNKNFSSTRNYD